MLGPPQPQQQLAPVLGPRHAGCVLGLPLAHTLALQEQPCKLHLDRPFHSC